MSAAALVYPHQLFTRHPARVAGAETWLLEDPLFFGTDRHWPLRVHRQRLTLHRASMKAWHRQATEAGGDPVHYVDLPDAACADSLDLLREHLPSGVDTLHVCDPCDDVLMRRLRRFADERGARLEVHPSPNFLTPPDFLAKHTGPTRKRPFMASFYKEQRQRMGILLEDDGGPQGGRWSFDADNRERLPRGHPVPPVPAAAPDEHVREALEWTRARFADNPGSLDGFAWPVTRRAALSWLDTFLAERFRDFGAYEDALSREHRVLFHSVLTPALNIGLLDPDEVVEAALAHGMRHAIPMNSLEGFVRQIIGWREFVAGLYRHRGPALRSGNHWNHRRKMPAAFYDASTGIPPVDDAIRRVLDHGWCHHIERLMVLGNFMLLCRIDPDEVYRWFMELFVDAFDWVMVPNVYGMSQFADGGTFTTKPYLSGSNYIRRMSHEPKGAWCEVWDALYWSFIADHLDFFAGNPRLAMMARTWQRMAPERQRAHRVTARDWLAGLDG